MLFDDDIPEGMVAKPTAFDWFLWIVLSVLVGLTFYFYSLPKPPAPGAP